jgi:hypothetical protein
MMSGMPLETCWAFNKLWNNKFYYKAASCWYFYWVIYDARIHEYQIARSLFVRHLHMPVYIVAVTVQAGTFLPPTQVSVIRDLLNLCCQTWKYDCILTIQFSSMWRYWPDGWPFRDILTCGLFSRQKHFMCTVLRDVSSCERDAPRSIMYSLTPQSRHSLRHLVAHSYICGRYNI